MRHYRFEILIAGALVLCSAIALGRVASNDFIVWDDLLYLTKNQHLQRGFGWQEIAWAFRSTLSSNWMPVAWLSHTLDYWLYGDDAGKHHLTSLILHTANAILLFLTLRAASGSRWPSAVAAFLFLLHPLQVEPVAWAIQRKTVLSGFFWLLTLAAYVRYVRRRGVGAYSLVLLACALGMMTKPTSVTLPFALLLFDFWPLRRISFTTGEEDVKWPGGKLFGLLWEKLPLFGMAAALSVATYLAQAETMKSFVPLPFGARIENAVVAYGAYISKFFWPGNLAVFYPHPDVSILAGAVVPALIVLLAVSTFSVAASRQSAYLLVGWLWFLGTLVPMLGLVQVGLQAMADRYMYISLIGLAIMVSYGGEALCDRWRLPKIPVLLAVSVVLIAFMGVGRARTQAWSNSIALFEDALRVTGHTDVTHSNLAYALAVEGRDEEAVRHYRQALASNPRHAMSHHNLGALLAGRQRYDEALQHYEAALAITPGKVEIHLDMGLTLLAQGKLEEAVDRFRTVLRLEPDHAGANNDLGVALAGQGMVDEAIVHYKRAIGSNPDYAAAYYNLAELLVLRGELEAAIAHYQQALRIDPAMAAAHFNLAVVFARVGKDDRAILHYQEALRLRPDLLPAHKNLAALLSNAGEREGAAAHYKEVLRIKPDDGEARRALSRLERAPGSEGPPDSARPK